MTEREVSLKQWLEKIGGSFGLNLKTLRPASSDAGFRSYFRIDGDGTTYIVMDSPREPGNVNPFIFVDDLFAKQGLNVPKIYAQALRTDWFNLCRAPQAFLLRGCAFKT